MQIRGKGPILINRKVNVQTLLRTDVVVKPGVPKGIKKSMVLAPVDEMVVRKLQRFDTPCYRALPSPQALLVLRSACTDRQ